MKAMRAMDVAMAVLVVLGLLAASASQVDAIVLAPHALFLDHHTRSGVLYIHNPGDSPEEVTVELEYGYPASDSAGGVHIELIPDPSPEAPSAAGWVRALPQRMRIAPGTRQAVRLLAQPPAGLKDGEYWSRIIVCSRAAQPPAPVTDDPSVRVGLTLEMRTITSLTYRKGPLSTGVELDDFVIDPPSDTLVAAVRLSRRGNAAYLGKIEFTLTDAQGREQGGWEQAIAVYWDLYRRYQLPTTGLAAGKYTLAVRLSTERQDIPSTQLLPAAVVERKLDFTLPPRFERGG